MPRGNLPEVQRRESVNVFQSLMAWKHNEDLQFLYGKPATHKVVCETIRQIPNSNKEKIVAVDGFGEFLLPPGKITNNLIEARLELYTINGKNTIKTNKSLPVIIKTRSRVQERLPVDCLLTQKLCEQMFAANPKLFNPSVTTQSYFGSPEDQCQKILDAMSPYVALIIAVVPRGSALSSVRNANARYFNNVFYHVFSGWEFPEVIPAFKKLGEKLITRK